MSLDLLLQESIHQAVKKGRHTVNLKDGLIIDMRMQNACILILTLYRINKLPSITEWETILKYWPWPINNKPITSGYTLSASLPIHPKFL